MGAMRTVRIVKERSFLLNSYLMARQISSFFPRAGARRRLKSTTSAATGEHDDDDVAGPAEQDVILDKLLDKLHEIVALLMKHPLIYSYNDIWAIFCKGNSYKLKSNIIEGNL